jgi:hypothetical protein
MNRIFTALAVAALLSGGAMTENAWAAVEAGKRTLITNPDVLESMGFPRDAQHVYMLNDALKPVEGEPEDFGFGSGFHFTAVSPKSFIGRQSTAATPWQYSGGDEGCCQNLSRLGPETFADAAFMLPSGANISAVRWWANDTNAAQDIAAFVNEICHPAFGAGPTVTTTIASAIPMTSGATGNQSGVLAGSGITVDNESCRYTVRVRFDDTTGLTLQKIRMQWTRQVSTAPAVASFSDVPTTHPQFRFIEALVDAGITGGCGAGVYCPDAPLTRGQMAVFLSVALGLNFP